MEEKVGRVSKQQLSIACSYKDVFSTEDFIVRKLQTALNWTQTFYMAGKSCTQRVRLFNVYLQLHDIKLSESYL